LSARDISLSEALSRVNEQVKWPDVRWASCEMFEGVIFPADEELGLFPLQTGRTGLVDRPGLLENELLLYSATASGQPLAEMVFKAEGLSAAQGSGLVKVGRDGPQMDVAGPRAGKLLWRIAEVRPASVPEKMDDELKRQIVRDIKTARAFELAVKKAEGLLSAAKTNGLIAAAEAQGLEVTTTDLFPRKTQATAQEEILPAMLQGQIDRIEAMRRLVISQPIGFYWSDVPGIALPGPQVRRKFITTAFSLVPEQIEPAGGDRPYPEKPYALASLSVPALRQVLVMQRAGYRPAVAPEYDEVGRRVLPRALAALNEWRMRKAWFSLKNIKERLNFQPVEQ